MCRFSIYIGTKCGLKHLARNQDGHLSETQYLPNFGHVSNNMPWDVHVSDREFLKHCTIDRMQRCDRPSPCPNPTPEEIRTNLDDKPPGKDVPGLLVFRMDETEVDEMLHVFETGGPFAGKQRDYSSFFEHNICKTCADEAIAAGQSPNVKIEANFAANQ